MRVKVPVVIQVDVSDVEGLTDADVRERVERILDAYDYGRGSVCREAFESLLESRMPSAIEDAVTQRIERENPSDFNRMVRRGGCRVNVNRVRAERLTRNLSVRVELLTERELLAREDTSSDLPAPTPRTPVEFEPDEDYEG